MPLFRLTLTGLILREECPVGSDHTDLFLRTILWRNSWPNRSCKMDAMAWLTGQKPVLKELQQRKQIGQRKEERKQPRLTDGKTDEFSPADWEGGCWTKSMKRKCMYSLCVPRYLRFVKTDAARWMKKRWGQEEKLRKWEGMGPKQGHNPTRLL